MNQKQKRRPSVGGADLLGGFDQFHTTENHPTPQPATVHQVRALHLIASHHVRPALALALAGLCYGEAR